MDTKAIRARCDAKCPVCHGWGEHAFCGEMVTCGCNGQYTPQISVADVTACLDTIEAQAKRIEVLEKALADMKTRYDDIGNTVLNVIEKSEDEGDRVYFGSTNDADMLRDLGRKYHEWRVDNELKGTQP